MKYEQLIYTDKKVVENLLQNEDEIILSKTIVGMVAGINDKEWVFKKLLNYINHKNYWVAKNSINGLGYLARTNSMFNKKKAIKELLSITEEIQKENIHNALEDIKIFCK